MIDNLSAFFHAIYDEEFGLLPTNASIKPVHIANGLGRALVGRTYDSDALAQFLRRSILNQTTRVQVERNPNSMILENYVDAFTSRDSGILDQDALSRLRSLAEGVLATDRAVFGEAAMSSYTLSNETLLTRDLSDVRCGAFIAELLNAGTVGDAATHIRTLLASDDDPWSTLALPMMQFALPRTFAAGDDPPQHTLLAIDADGNLASHTLSRLRASFDRLARFEQGRGSKLNSLRRMVMFSCFVIHVHLVARYSETDERAPRPPILIDMFDGSRTSLRNASRASLRAAGDVLEALISRRIRERIAKELEAANIDDIVAAFPEGRKRVRTRVREGFDAYRGAYRNQEDQNSDLDALSEALWQVGTEDLIHPVEFLTELGRRAGFLTPWTNTGRGGKLQKRYGITTEFLEALVAATVEPGQPLDFPEFLDALRENYGIIVGQRADDQVVRCNNLSGIPFGTPTSVAEEDLRLNVEALRRAILEAGYAKAYADGQTVITTDPESMAVL
ncbi:hypothetical protein [Verrucosispora sp. NA02020]|uniref:hypothetical protein n=1 Tax=Verrucosispora sp. NA02020 TaxID=2742132 RepID=UPI003D71E34A